MKHVIKILCIVLVARCGEQAFGRWPLRASLVKLAFLVVVLLPIASVAAEDLKLNEFSFRVRHATATVRLVTNAQAYADQLHITFSDPRVADQVISCRDADIELAPTRRSK